MDVQLSHRFIIFGVMLLAALLVGACGETENAIPEPTSAESATDTPVIVEQAPSEQVQPTEPPKPTEPLKPTSTPTQEPTPTSTPEADPRQELGDSAWGAVFEEGTQTWYQYETSYGRAEVRDNRLVLTSYTANSYDNWSMSYPLMTDFYLEVRFTTGAQCSGKDRYGIFFRAPDPTHGYLYNASCDGAFQVREWNGEAFTQLIDWTVSEHIIPGPEMEHRLGVWAEGDQYRLYVNGFQIGEFTDDTYTDEGTFGVAFAATDTLNFTVEVTEARAWELPD